MKLTYYGVRGSIPAPGPDTALYGGNTSCVVIEAGKGLMILDAGTGIRRLGSELMRREFGKGAGKASVLFSHTHWDHIQGWPFFVPVYIPGNEFHLYGEHRLGKTLETVIENQQNPPNFPEDARFNAKLSYHEVKEWQPFEVGEGPDKMRVTSARLNHPNGVSAYRIEHAGAILTYATDTEHYDAPDWKLAKLAKDADVLIYDGQYTPEEYPQKVRWGHSTYAKGAEMAKLAGVKELHLFHHDPTHSDKAIDDIVERAQCLFPNTRAAQEGLSIVLGSQACPNVVAAFTNDLGGLDGLGEPEIRKRYDAWAADHVKDAWMRDAYWGEISAHLSKE